MPPRAPSRGTPANADVGSVTITVRATDGSAAFVEDQFVLWWPTPTMRPPWPMPIADQAATEDAPFSFQFAANTFADVDVGDTLTYTASGAARLAELRCRHAHLLAARPPTPTSAR